MLVSTCFLFLLSGGEASGGIMPIFDMLRVAVQVWPLFCRACDCGLEYGRVPLHLHDGSFGRKVGCHKLTLICSQLPLVDYSGYSRVFRT